MEHYKVIQSACICPFIHYTSLFLTLPWRSCRLSDDLGSSTQVSVMSDPPWGYADSPEWLPVDHEYMLYLMKTTRSGRLGLPKTLPTTIRLISSVHVHHVCCDIEVIFLILLSVLCLCVIFWFCCFKTERFFFVDFIMQWII